MSNLDFNKATDAIVEHGCPICGDEPNFYFINGPQGIALSPCGHTVTLRDALDMAEVEMQIESKRSDAEEPEKNDDF